MPSKESLVISAIATLCLLIGFTICHARYIDKIMAYDTAIEQCERDLPRSQRCVITAVPEGEEL